MKINVNNDAGCLEFIAFYEKLLQKSMDPYRRCRSDSFSAEGLQEYLMDAYMAFQSEKEKEKIDALFSKTNEFFDEYYQKSRTEFGFSPDVFAYRNEVEGELKRLKNK